MSQCKLYCYYEATALVSLCYFEYLLIIANSFILSLFEYHYFSDWRFRKGNVPKNNIRLYWDANTDNSHTRTHKKNKELANAKTSFHQIYKKNSNQTYGIIFQPSQKTTLYRLSNLVTKRCCPSARHMAVIPAARGCRKPHITSNLSHRKGLERTEFPFYFSFIIACHHECLEMPSDKLKCFSKS